ncbi:hypothetical protein MO973_28350 [Paenibacillus sp. TRM 82003]|uniref:hypothetical protein n=1 Tax=Kineococcus sp. TRM81007 TaxID=2925831 RepID=UPI001F579214|nr:hypothetical protein [Kineococcus sp. TRM81007]MCI2238739.1 hypothetical protein [Kineococcus sp. TRM81007]MCI3924146.1 hypothetical protein [Paenibacillus sp. TRM 82003]
MARDPQGGDARRVGRWVLDLALLVAVGSVVVVLVSGRWEEAVRFGLVLGAIVTARLAAVPPTFAGAFSVLLLLAMWASVQHWYRAISWFDVVVHFLTPGSIAAVAYYVLVQWRLLPGPRELPTHLRSWAPVLWTTLTGVTIAVGWEFYEWTVEQFSPRGMHVGYTDTVVDLFAGTCGSLVAGLLVHAHSRSRRGLVLPGDGERRTSPAGRA